METVQNNFGVVKITSKYVKSIAYKISKDNTLRRRLMLAKQAKDQSPLIQVYTMDIATYNNKMFVQHLTDFLRKADKNAKVEIYRTDQPVTVQTNDEVWGYAFQTLKTTGAISINLKPTKGVLLQKHPTDTEPRYFVPYDTNGEPRIKKKKKLQDKSGAKSEIYITSSEQDAIDGYNCLVVKSLHQAFAKVKYMTNNYIGPLPDKLMRELTVTGKPKDEEQAR